jgi:hypothetical protein
VPFRPGANPDQAARLRRWTFALLAAAGLLLVVSVAAGVFWVNRLGQGSNEASPGKDETTTGQDSAVTPRPPPAAAASRIRTDRLLDVMGGLCVSHLGQTYITLGLLEDGVEEETYTKVEATKNVIRTVAWINQVDKSLEKLKDAGLTPGDMEAVARIRKASLLLRAQADALQSYWKSGAKEQADLCRTARERSWAAIRELQAKD